jgi:hypothetical protein
MSRATTCWSLVVWSCLVVACKQPESRVEPEAEPQVVVSEAPPEATPAIEATPADREPVTAPTPTEPTPTVEPAAVIPAAPGVVPILEVAPTKVEARWREVASPSEPLTFIYLAGGVLARSRSGYHDLADGSLSLRSEIEPPSQPDDPKLLGYWPTDVWELKYSQWQSFVDPRGDEYFADALEVARLRDYRWVVQKHEGDHRFPNSEARKSWTGGLLVRNGNMFWRLGDGVSEPESQQLEGEFEGYAISTFVETRSGEIYTITEADEALYVQRDCQDQACVDANAKQLPFGPKWSFATQVPRQRHSVSLTATCGGDVSKEFLLHYEKGGWKLETMPTAASGLWPSDDGGLWALLGSELWHRDPDGGWRNVALPAGAQSISAAMLLDQSELWIAAQLGGKPKVFATHAKAQEPPAAAPEITTQTG